MAHRIAALPLRQKQQMDTLVEFKTTYNTDICELYIFETHQTSHNVSLRFDNLTFTSMIQGKKLVKVGDKTPVFSYLPGSSVLVAPGEEMLIDFPEADAQPSQCMALSINEDYLADILYTQNVRQQKINDGSRWYIEPDVFVVTNNTGLAGATNNILRIMMEDSLYKDQLVDLAMKELVIRLMHSQAQELVRQGHVRGRFAELLQYIRNNLHEKLKIDMLARLAHLSKSNFYKLFKQELGISPNDFILKERIRRAKQLLLQYKNISEVAFQTGFSDTNYFIKIFKRMVGTTPKTYQMQQSREVASCAG
ncbi:MAG: AraC family transcriptional regulator [Bacteroidetes bacterium 47-18]|nr:MAG: AraC family transcriptional regulator [Bacteroidetes bacterium 47-18]